MKNAYDFIVVGKGMMGAAAARHLSRVTANIALIGPDEPADRVAHTGVFASHYDSGRITRTIDGDPDWALLANRSIARYRGIERESGISFYSQAGCLMTGPRPGGPKDFLGPVLSVRERFGLDAALLDGAAIKERFPYFSFPAGSAGVFEARGAGHIDPRRLVRAQVECARLAGATIIPSQAARIVADAGGVAVTTDQGDTYRAAKVLIAVGVFSVSRDLFPTPLDLVVKARTIVLFELTDDDAALFAGMPSLIDETGALEEHFYLVPPVRYPDGKFYLKIGGDPADILLDGDSAIKAWFRGQGDPKAAEHLERLLRRLIPGIRPVSVGSLPCVTTYTRHGNPYIGATRDERIAIVTGGNGAAAKSSDEIGRLGALAVCGATLTDEGYGCDFSVQYR